MASRSRPAKSRAPAHQNKFAFRHNKGSHKSKSIMATNTSYLVCRSCADKLEWRKRYRKYKPLSAPATCHSCRGKTIKRAYHTLCEACACDKGVCAKCGKPQEHDDDDGKTPAQLAAEEAALQRRLKDLPERQRRTILRTMEEGKELKPEHATALYGEDAAGDDDDDDSDEEDGEDGEDGEEDGDSEGEEDGEDKEEEEDGAKASGDEEDGASEAGGEEGEQGEQEGEKKEAVEEDKKEKESENKKDDGAWDTITGVVAEVVDTVVEHLG